MEEASHVQRDSSSPNCVQCVGIMPRCRTIDRSAPLPPGGFLYGPDLCLHRCRGGLVYELSFLLPGVSALKWAVIAQTTR
ncbi:unnamed protein product [Gadus morhua 'NCC']